jgi:nucleotide-binding universal stress UspA family protein
MEQTVDHLIRRFSPRLERMLSTAWTNLAEALTPDALEAGPPPGDWRVNVGLPREDKLFAAILVSLSGADENWLALEQALPIARHEGAVLRGLHVVSTEKELNGAKVQQVCDRFYRRCKEEDVQGEFAVETGNIAACVVQRATWTDLVVLHMIHPPGTSPLNRLRSGYRNIIMRCPRPVLAVPGLTQKLETALLAYDGSPKAKEALFLSSYLVCCWDAKLIVMGSFENEQEQQRTLNEAQEYLEKSDIQAEYLSSSGKPAKTLLEVAEERDVDLMVMGGYGAGPLVNLVVSSTVDQVLRSFRKPVLICR